MFLSNGGFGHVWGEAIPDKPNNQNDPIIYYDPRGNEVNVGSPCLTCSGWFGDRYRE